MVSSGVFRGSRSWLIKKIESRHQQGPALWVFMKIYFKPLGVFYLLFCLIETGVWAGGVL
ncbi:hypothetical protein OIU79_024453 [Salix purpurea]|uniref:Uncharacterized protein n=1 Tax=Salix purpurea TaxID=77065 RepID=A0A9Q1AAI4_SALPP|nr:hypothetical protein OIU79_024453 [Salix purpurea]